jgi:hypothetical protein
VINVWKKTQNPSVIIRGDDAVFDAYKLPFFFNLRITSTGLKTSERNNVKTLVEENGGKYDSSFTAAVDILIMEKESIGSQKFDAAKKLKKLCLSSAWITDSISQGYAMPADNYIFGNSKNRAASTPTKASDGDLAITKSNPVPAAATSVAPKDAFENNGATNSPFTPVRQKSIDDYGSTPKTPALNVERLVEGMPTPQRQDTLAVLLENQKKYAVSPRQKRLQEIINTPSTRVRMMAENIESPRPELPDCMKPYKMDYGIRPNSTPNSQAFHKRKLEGLDLNYIPPAEKKRCLEIEPATVSCQKIF